MIKSNFEFEYKGAKYIHNCRDNFVAPDGSKIFKWHSEWKELYRVSNKIKHNLKRTYRPRRKKVEPSPPKIIFTSRIMRHKEDETPSDGFNEINHPLNKVKRSDADKVGRIKDGRSGLGDTKGRVRIYIDELKLNIFVPVGTDVEEVKKKYLCRPVI